MRFPHFILAALVALATSFSLQAAAFHYWHGARPGYPGASWFGSHGGLGPGRWYGPGTWNGKPGSPAQPVVPGR